MYVPRFACSYAELDGVAMCSIVIVEENSQQQIEENPQRHIALLNIKMPPLCTACIAHDVVVFRCQYMLA